jgi:hypothetical protein
MRPFPVRRNAAQLLNATFGRGEQQSYRPDEVVRRRYFATTRLMSFMGGGPLLLIDVGEVLRQCDRRVLWR